ncbi:LOW QUALITY PROTEIN: hypothetical protein CVT25_014162 [Psilocybe cyanescens]|uniref:DUF6534 domain-containing protein n=1 Tax=Psilocybe cyanescens TaxID=93625 RepID=A0A409XUV4_PSICY|nr:LOW QUALITY PROTEIN: hypothetical protein CVT25_014162 [Psilocybe cyanescens]
MSIASILTDTYGAYTIGTFVSAILLGVTCSQVRHSPLHFPFIPWFMDLKHKAWYYFNTYSDPPIIKYTYPRLIFLLDNELFKSACTTSKRLVSVGFPRLSGVSFDLALIVLVYKCIVIAHNPSLSVKCLHKRFSLALLFRERLVSELPGLPETLAKAILSSAAAIDIVIASTLSYYLHKNRSGIKQRIKYYGSRTDKIINRLMIYTINNGILTSVLDVVTLSLVIARSKDLIFFAVSQVLATVYSNSLLATLNSRNSAKNQDLDVVGSNVWNFAQSSVSGSIRAPERQGPDRGMRSQASG